MVSSSISASTSSPMLPEFFRSNVPIVEDALESFQEVDSVPAELVRFFRGAIREESMRNRLVEYEYNSVDQRRTNVLFSGEFTDTHLPATFKHLLCRLDIVLNISSVIMNDSPRDMRYSALNCRQKAELRNRLTDARKNELNSIRRAFQAYKTRFVDSRELCFLINMAISMINDVLYENE